MKPRERGKKRYSYRVAVARFGGNYTTMNPVISTPITKATEARGGNFEKPVNELCASERPFSRNVRSVLMATMLRKKT